VTRGGGGRGTNGVPRQKGQSMVETGGNESRDESRKEDIRAWSIVAGIAIFFFLWGLVIFFTVGTKGPPDWGFGVIEDIPGESTYSIHGPRPFRRMTVPPIGKELVERQHIREQTGKAGPVAGR